MDISNLSVQELETLKTRLPGEIERRRNEVRSDAIKKVEEFAKSLGFTVEDLFGGRGRKSNKDGRVKVAAKFRHPTNTGLTWTGRGRKPAWVEEYLQSGKLEDLKI